MATWRMVVRTTAPGMPGPGYSTFHWRDGGAAEEIDGADAATALSAFYTAIAAQQGTGVSHYFDGRLVEVDGDRLLAAPTWTRPGTSNASPSDALTGALCVCVTWRTESNSRSGRGRTFLSGWREGSNDGSGTPESAVLTAVTSAISGLVTFNGNPLNGAFVVYSPTSSLSRDITSGTVRDVWAVLRSRRD